MKNRTLIITMIALLSVLVIGLITFLIFMLNGNFRFRSFTMFQIESKTLVLDQIYTEDFNRIEMNIDSGNIYIKESLDEKVQVLGYGNEDDITVTVDTKNQKLNIRIDEKDCHFFCFRKTIPKVEVYLPKEYSHLIKIDSKYGDTEIEKFLNAEITLDQKYGDITIGESKSVKIHNDYGDIRIDQVVDADIECSAGDVVIGTVSNLKVQNNYGDINIQKVDYYLDIKEDCGEVNIREVNLKKGSSIKNSYGDIEIGFTNEIYIDANTSLGDKNIRNNYRESKIMLRIQNSCGDIVVNN